MDEIDLLRAVRSPAPITTAERERLVAGALGEADPSAPDETSPVDTESDSPTISIDGARQHERSSGARSLRLVSIAAAAAVLVAGAALVVAPRDVTDMGVATAPTTTVSADADQSRASALGSVPGGPTVDELAATAAGATAPVLPPGGYYYLHTTTLRDSTFVVDDGEAEAVRTSQDSQYWMALDGTGTVQRIESELDPSGAPSASQPVGFGIPSVNDLDPVYAVWAPGSSATIGDRPSAVREWLVAHDLLPVDGSGEDVALAVGVLLSWPSVPPSSRAAALELLGREADLTIEGAQIDGRPAVKLAVGSAWIAMTETDAGLLAYETVGQHVTVHESGVTSSLPEQ